MIPRERKMRCYILRKLPFEAFKKTLLSKLNIRINRHMAPMHLKIERNVSWKWNSKQTKSYDAIWWEKYAWIAQEKIRDFEKWNLQNVLPHISQIFENHSKKLSKYSELESSKLSFTGFQTLIFLYRVKIIRGVLDFWKFWMQENSESSRNAFQCETDHLN